MHKNRSVNIFDIARLSGVSTSTVSRVLNNHGGVSVKTRSRVEKAIKDSMYIPNNSARNLSRHDTRTVVVIVNGITNPFFTQMFSVIQKELEKERFSMILQSHETEVYADCGRSKNGTDIIDTAISVYKEKRPKGIMFLGGFFEEKHENLALIDVPVVLATSTVYANCDRSKFSSVTIDDEREAYHITKYICQNGHKQIAVIGHHPQSDTISGRRFRGFDKAVREYGISASEIRLHHEIEFSYEAGYNATKELLSGSSFTCVFCFSDVLAIGAMKAIRESGLRIPEDISVVGFDGISIGSYMNPILTTVKQPAHDIAYKAVTGLLNSINSGKPHSHFIVPATIVEGGSFCSISG